MPTLKKLRNNCLSCGKLTARPKHIYCSNMCQLDYQYKKYIDDWQKGNIKGLQGLGIVSRHIKRYLREKFGNKCYKCGWSETNCFTGKVPLVADHIDGDWRNNTENNLRLVCPNCDALSSRYAGLNKGKGRGNRASSKRAQEARMLINKLPN